MFQPGVDLMKMVPLFLCQMRVVHVLVAPFRTSARVRALPTAHVSILALTRFFFILKCAGLQGLWKSGPAAGQ
jgi:hypothetical protein